jgi:hypothetical protein
VIPAIELRFARALLLGLCLAGPSGAALAADPPPAVDPRSEARAHYEEGLRLAERSSWSEAHAAFARAQELFPAPSNLFNIGQCQRALGRYTGALVTFRAFLAAAQGPEQAELRKAAEGYITELDGRIARLRVLVEPEGAEIAVDGRPVQGELLLDPGRHTVRAQRAGFTTRFADRDLAPGEVAVVRITLERLPARLAIRASVAQAEVLVDGVRVGRAPWEGERASGDHRVEVRAKGFVPYEWAIKVAPGERAELDARLKPEKTNLATRWWFWTIVGSAVAGAIVTTYVATRDVPPAAYDGGSLGWVVQP